MKNNREFIDSLNDNELSYWNYFQRISEIALSMYEWKNLPDSIDPRFLELCLLSEGKCLFFKDEDMGDYLALRCALGGKFNVYNIPTERRAFASNGYNKQLDENNSVIIYNNFLRNNSIGTIEEFAKRMYNIDRTIDVNINAQKTPILIKCKENQRQTMKNLYMKYQGNEPFIFGDKNLEDDNSIKVLNTQAPFLADKLYDMKTKLWNECMTYLGIPSVDVEKKERLISSEVKTAQGGTQACRNSRLEMRKLACKQINEMFGLNIDVEFRQDVDTSAPNIDKEIK